MMRRNLTCEVGGIDNLGLDAAGRSSYATGVGRLAQHLEKLPALVEIARLGSLQKAAVSLRLSQPALTKSVLVWEDALGKQLFHRSRKGMTPTAEGQLVLALARRLLAEAREVEMALGDAAQDEPHGEVRVVCHEMIAGYIWPAVLKAAADLAPKLKPELYTNCSARAMARQVADFEADAAVGAELPELPATQRTPLYDESYGFYVRSEPTNKGARPLPRRPTLKLETLIFLPPVDRWPRPFAWR